MRRTHAFSLALLTGLGLAGCADNPSGVSGPIPKSAANTELAYLDGTQYMVYQSMEEAVASTNLAQITSTNPSVYFSDQNVFGANEMSYYGNRAQIRSALTLTSTRGSYSSAAPLNVDKNNVFDWWYTARADQRSLYVPDTCGFVAQVAGDYAVQLFVLVPNRDRILEAREVGRDYTSNSTQAAQGECNCSNEQQSLVASRDSDLPSSAYMDDPTTTRPGCGGSTGGGGGGGMVYCITITTDYYEYDPNTGNVTHLRTTVEQFCTNMT